MMFRLAATATALATLGCASAASAQAPPDAKADVRCLVVSMMMLNAQSADQRQAGMMSAMYFFGRVDGGAPGLDLEAALVAQIRQAKPEQIRADALRCGSELQSRGQAMQAIGARLSAREKLPELPTSD